MLADRDGAMRRMVGKGPRRSVWWSSIALALTALSAGFAGTPAHAASKTYTIGVDNASPAGHLFQYTDFFPRVGTTVHEGDVVDFRWNSASPDGVHTATLLKTTTSLADLPAAPIIADTDGRSVQLQIPPATDNPSDPSCGTVTSPCVFDGTAQVNSGAFNTAGGHDFYATINVRAGTKLTFVCLLHPAMVGSLSVVSRGASTVHAVDAAAAAQYTRDTKEALAAEAGVRVAPASSNTDGSKSWHAQAGAEGPFEQVLEFFPRNLKVARGDSVKWTTKVHDIHTATFPSGDASAADDWHAYTCDAGPIAEDTVAAAPPAVPCSSYALYEEHFLPLPAGPTTLASPTTVATSGVLEAELPFPDHYTFTFGGVGTYTYQCKVHDHMSGTVSTGS